jgi:hypothetical protein
MNNKAPTTIYIVKDSINNFRVNSVIIPERFVSFENIGKSIADIAPEINKLFSKSGMFSIKIIASAWLLTPNLYAMITSLK